MNESYLIKLIEEHHVPYVPSDPDFNQSWHFQTFRDLADKNLIRQNFMLLDEGLELYAV